MLARMLTSKTVKLDLSYSSLGDQHLQAMLAAGPRNLPVVNLRGCKSVTAKACEYVGQYCQGLQELDLRETDMDMDSAMDHLVGNGVHKSLEVCAHVRLAEADHMAKAEADHWVYPGISTGGRGVLQVPLVFLAPLSQARSGWDPPKKTKYTQCVRLHCNVPSASPSPFGGCSHFGTCSTCSAPQDQHTCSSSVDPLQVVQRILGVS